MPDHGQRLRRGVGYAFTALAMALLVVQYLPLAPLAHYLAGSGHACTEAVCHCDESCTRGRCANHLPGAKQAGVVSGHASSHDQAPGPPLVRSCGGMPGTAGAMVVSKSLFAPVASVRADVSSLLPVHVSWREVFAPQNVADELFRPPRHRIG